jgi:hypothetical protein
MFQAIQDRLKIQSLQSDLQESETDNQDLLASNEKLLIQNTELLGRIVSLTGFYKAGMDVSFSDVSWSRDDIWCKAIELGLNKWEAYDPKVHLLPEGTTSKPGQPILVDCEWREGVLTDLPEMLFAANRRETSLNNLLKTILIGYRMNSHYQLADQIEETIRLITANELDFEAPEN